MDDTTLLTYDTAVERIVTGIRKTKGAAVADERIGPDTAFWLGGDPDQLSLAFDSLDFLELIVFLEQEYGWTVPEGQLDAEGCRTVGDLAGIVLATAGGADAGA